MTNWSSAWPSAHASLIAPTKSCAGSPNASWKRRKASDASSRELHDEIGQQLTGVKMLLETLEESVQEHDATPSALKAGASADSSVGPALYAPHLSEISDAVADTLERVRDLSLDLRPAVLDSLGLLPALQWQFERFTHQTGVQVDFSADGLDHRLPTRLEAGIYRLIQEALTKTLHATGVAEAIVQL